MNFIKIINNFITFILLAIEFKKIFILWISVYIAGLLLIYVYKINYYQFDLEIKIFQQYTPMERIYPKGDDPLIFKLIKKDLSKYNVSSIDDTDDKFIKITSTIVKSDKEKIQKTINEIKLEIDNYKKSVIEVTKKTNQTLNNQVRNLIIDDVQERIHFYKYYFTQKYLNTLFINEYSNFFVIDNYKYESINQVNVNLILKLFSFYILIFYLLNLLSLFFLRFYNKK